MEDSKDRHLPDVTLDDVGAAVRTALSATEESRKLQFPNDEAIKDLWEECKKAQQSYIMHVENEIINESQRRLSECLDGAWCELQTLLDFRWWRWGLELNDHQLHVLGLLTETLAAVEAIRNNPELQQEVLRTDLVSPFAKPGDLVPQLTDAFMKTLEQVHPDAGRLKLPPHFVAAILPSIAGEAMTPGAVKTKLASKKKSTPPQIEKTE